MPSAPLRLAVVGGGIAGLVVARDLANGPPDLQITVLEADRVVGGKLALAEVAGHLVDVGAESMLAARPEVPALLAELGVTHERVGPTPASASIWSRGRLHPVPRATLMGVPADSTALEQLLTPAEVARFRQERAWPGAAVTSDVSVARYLGTRLGRAVVDRLVDPLLGGVYAGRSEDLSLQATMPAVWQIAVAGGSLRERAAALAAASPAPVGPGSAHRASGDRLTEADGRGASDPVERPARPPFAGLVGGVGRLPQLVLTDLAAHAPRVQVETGACVVGMQRADQGQWRLDVAGADGIRTLVVDAVIVAVPAPVAARLLAPISPGAASALREIPTASSAVITLALPRAGMPPLPGSGFLVPAVDGRLIKGATFSARKWAWTEELDPAVTFLRASVGRAGQPQTCERPDADLVAAVHAEIGEALGAPLPPPVDTLVTRWRDGLPQYTVGHVDRIARIRDAVDGEPGLEVAGAAYEGVGIPAVIASARRAAQAVLDHLHTRPRVSRSQPRSSAMSDVRPAGGRPVPAKPPVAKIKEINATIRYAMWSVFAVAEPLADADRAAYAGEIDALWADLAASGVVTRGVYDVAGLRADADLMIWWHAESIEAVQDAYHRFLRTDFGAHLDPVWSVAALHRPAEFNQSHIPAFMADEEPRDYLCVYPFVRSYDWYLLDDKERRSILAEHGRQAREYPDVRANTIASFALGDYEWILAFEADELHRIVDLMREMRATRARLHVREEIPFYTGPRVDVRELISRQR